jgi:hypothetical protein
MKGKKTTRGNELSQVIALRTHEKCKSGLQPHTSNAP